MKSLPSALRDLSRPSSRISFIDGLRGFSVLIVVLGHAFFVVKPAIPLPLTFLFDADLGVSTFLTLSGFVITSILVIERAKNGTIRLGEFFSKRLTKLVPSLFLFLIFAWVLNECFPEYSPTQRPFGVCSFKEFAIAALFLTQVMEHHCALTYHTWSLSLEEIFYLSWAPFLSLLRVEFYRPIYLLLLIAVGPFARLFLFYAPGIRFLRSYAIPQLSLLTYADSIGTGCLGAILLHAHRPATERVFRWFGTRAIVIALVLFYLSTFQWGRFPQAVRLNMYLGFVIPLVQGCLVTLFILSCYFGTLPNTLHRVITSRPLLFLGRISYSLYLWQQAFLLPLAAPIATLLGINSLRLPIAIAVATLSFIYVEDAFTRWLRARFHIGSSSLWIVPIAA